MATSLGAAAHRQPRLSWTLAGLIAMLVGGTAIVISGTVRRTPDKLITGELYVRDPYPDVLRLVGAVLLAAGLVALCLAAARRTNVRAGSVFATGLWILVAVTVIGAALLLTVFASHSVLAPT